MEQIRAKTEDGSMYIFTTDSETDKSPLWGDCLRVQRDGTLRAFGTVALHQDSLRVGESMKMVVPVEVHETGRYATADVARIDRQEIDESELAVIAALRELSLDQFCDDGPDVVEKFVDRSLASIRSLKKTHPEDSAR